MTTETYAAHLADQLGSDPEHVLHLFRQQVEKVHAAAVKIARLKGTLAGLATTHGARGQTSLFDHARKALLAQIMEERRHTLLSAGEKVTESALDSFARADSRYREYLDRARRELEEYEHAQADLSEAFADLEREKGVQAYLEARLAILRATAYAYGAETRLQS